MMDKYAWQAAAYYSAKRVIARKYRAKAFLAEELLKDVVKDIGETSDFRVWGNVVRELSKDRFIQANGYAAAKSSHYSPKRVWVKVPCWSKR